MGEPGVITPPAEVKAEEAKAAEATAAEEAKVAEETAAAEAKTAEEAKATEEAEAAKVEEEAAAKKAEEGPSAEDLQKTVDEQKAKIEALEKREPEAPKAAPEARRVQHLATDRFLSETKPQAMKEFTDSEATPEKQFNTMYDLFNNMLAVVQEDQITPGIQGLATHVVQLRNEVEIRDLRAEDSAFTKTHEKAVRTALAKMTLKDKADDEVVRGVYHKIIGAGGGKKATPAAPAIPAKPAAALKDVAGGGKSGAPAKPSSIRLTPEQETDRKAMEAETGDEMAPEVYYTKLTNRQATAKARGNKIPKTLRDF